MAFLPLKKLFLCHKNAVSENKNAVFFNEDNKQAIN